MDRNPWNVYLTSRGLVCEPCGKRMLEHATESPLCTCGAHRGLRIFGPYALEPFDRPLFCDLGSQCLRVPDDARTDQAISNATFLCNPLSIEGRRRLAELVYAGSSIFDTSFFLAFYTLTPDEIAEVGAHEPPGSKAALPPIEETTTLRRLERGVTVTAALLDAATGRVITSWSRQALHDAVEDGLLDLEDLQRSAYHFAARFGLAKPN